MAERVWRAFPAMDIATDAAALADPEIGLRRIGEAIATFWAPPLAVAFFVWLLPTADDFRICSKASSRSGKRLPLLQ